jgi:hypothetical protein
MYKFRYLKIITLSTLIFVEIHYRHFKITKKRGFFTRTTRNAAYFSNVLIKASRFRKDGATLMNLAKI